MSMITLEATGPGQGKVGEAGCGGVGCGGRVGGRVVPLGDLCCVCYFDLF